MFVVKLLPSTWVSQRPLRLPTVLKAEEVPTSLDGSLRLMYFWPFDLMVRREVPSTYTGERTE